MLEKTRYELKFICYNRFYDDIIKWIKSSNFMLKTSYPQRIVNSIYFDDNEFTCFQDNLSGISRREKVRYRWYGESIHPADGTLEVKNRHNNLGWKYLYPATEIQFSTNDSWPSIISKIKSKIPNDAKYFLNKYPEPTLITRYQRDYYESFDKKIRVTIDRNQKYIRQMSIYNANFSRKPHISDIITVEVKCNAKHRFLASNLVKNLPLRRSKYSKYVYGMIHSSLH